MTIEPGVLEGTYGRLESLNEGHRDRPCQAISDGELWTPFVTLVPHPSDIGRFLNDAQKAQETGDGIAFATIDTRNDKVAGSTRFMNEDLPNKRVEIGQLVLVRHGRNP